MNWSDKDYQSMALALQLAKKGQYTARPNPMVGCVIVRDGQIVGQGWHRKFGGAHAEVNALQQAGDKAKGATCYVTLEPCSHVGKTGPCATALIDSGVIKVIAAMQDPNPQVCGKGFEHLKNAGVHTEFGLLEKQARQLNRGFVSRLQKNRPWLSLKLAMSLDGRTALADGSSKWITGSAARLDVQKLRARQDAIITGIGTLLTDNPSMTVRTDGQSDWFEGLESFQQPTRILLDRNAKASLEAQFFNRDASVWWVALDSETAQKTRLSPLSGPSDNSHIKRIQKQSLQELIDFCAEQGMNNVLVEAGHKLAGQFIQQNLVDELIIYIAAKLMGNTGLGLLDLKVNKMIECPELRLNSIHQFGDDIRLIYTPVLNK